MMKKLTMLILMLSILSGCAGGPALQKTDLFSAISGSPVVDKSSEPRLEIEAYPRVGFAPLRVSLRAVLHNVPSTDPVFSCVWESWDFGDGSVSSEKSSCDGVTSVDLEYYVDHVYRSEGTYEVRFVLGDNHVLSAPVQIRVIGDSF